MEKQAELNPFERSPRINEYVYIRESFISKFGLLIFFLILCTFFAAVWFVKFPSRIEANGMIVSNIDTMEIRSGKSGSLLSVIRDGSRIQREDEILRMKTTVNNIAEDSIITQRIVAPVAGIVKFITPLSKGCGISSGELIGYIIPDGNSYFALVSFSKFFIDDIKIGQQVQIEVEGYNSTKEGYLEGLVIYKHPSDSNSSFNAKVKLSNSLTTNIGTSITFFPGLKATAHTTIDSSGLVDLFIR